MTKLQCTRVNLFYLVYVNTIIHATFIHMLTFNNAYFPYTETYALIKYEHKVQCVRKCVNIFVQQSSCTFIPRSITGCRLI